MKSTKKVVVIQRVLPHYRISFFDALAEKLRDSDIELEVVYGNEKEGSVPKTAEGNWAWAKKIPNQYITLLGKELVWQSAVRKCSNADLVIVEQANRLILNHILLIKKNIVRKPRIAFLGHGKNFQSKENDFLSYLSEKLKQYLLSSVDWWFSYTELSTRHLIKLGIDKRNITTFNNCVDTTEFKRCFDLPMTESDRRNFTHQAGIVGEQVGLFCGGMYQEKRLEFLLESCLLIKEKLPDFEMLFIGGGPDEDLLVEACKKYQWMKYLGPKFSEEKARYFELSGALLMPGLVGLAIVDSFVSKTPIITTDIDYHSPEIEYISSGNNGLMTGNTIQEYANAVIKFYRDENLRGQLARGCSESSEQITLDGMVDKFAAGVCACLNEYR